ncbi:hypothetical protein TNCV_423721 [Trichonephila clavipes]|nr:hypothetical protein TNCV_423721 [Trichonephila clavipes]
METFKKFKLACIAELQAMPDHHPDEPFYRRAVSGFKVEETINLAVSDLASFPPLCFLAALIMIQIENYYA